MHVIIAGTARAGKTTLSLMLNKEGFVHYKMDSIKRGICEAYNFKYNDWEKVSPVMCTIINRMILDNKTDTNYGKEKYLFDTPFIYPRDIEMIDTTDTLVIFLGYPKTTYQESFNNIRKYDKENYWTSRIDDSELMKWCVDNVNFSKYLEAECYIRGIKFFDTSNNREEVLKEVVEYIKSKEIEYEKSSGKVKKIK